MPFASARQDESVQEIVSGLHAFSEGVVAVHNGEPALEMRIRDVAGLAQGLGKGLE